MESTAQVRSAHASPNIRIGTAGWYYKDWNGVFYPPGMQQRKRHALEYLARFFDTTEINTSFYGPLKPELAKLWCRRVAAVNPKFLFTAKLYRAFTHSPMAVMEPTSAATIRPTDEDEMPHARRTRRTCERRTARRAAHPVSRVIQEHIAEPRISRPIAAPVHRVSARGRGARLELEQSAKPWPTSRRRTSPSAISTSQCWATRSRRPST